MIIERFIGWVKTAPSGARAEAAGALARAYLVSPLSAHERNLAAVALTSLLDDPSVAVRRAMAEVLAPDAASPAHVVAALAQDVVEVATPVIVLSPLLEDGDLVDLAASGTARIQSAVAARLDLQPSVAAALAEVAGLEACIVLARNPGAALTGSIYVRMIERHGSSALLREALLARTDLPIGMRQLLVRTLADNLAAFVSGRDWISADRARAVAGDACERATMGIATGLERAERRRLVRHLRTSGQLTPGFLLRALVAGNLGVFEAAVAELAGVDEARVASLLRDRQASAFDALCRRAGLPDSAQVAFRVALDVWRIHGAPEDGQVPVAVRRAMVERVLSAHASARRQAADPLTQQLRRLATDAARDEARALAGAIDGRAAA